MEIFYRHQDSGYVGFRDRWIGSTKAARNAISPLKQMSQLRVPTFHTYSKDEPGIRPEHAKRLQRALKKHGVPHEFFLEAADAENDVVHERYRRIEAFLAEHL